jgi:cytochrome c biogenesis protein CcmG, thiol:disulfide interchange protein DsbE
MDRAAALAIALACSLAACARGDGSESASGATIAQVGRPAPGWTQPSIPGPTLSLASLRGKPVYLNFFATWCPPCVQEAPSIDALSRAFGPAGLRVVGVDVLENPRKAALFRTQHHLSYPVVIDTGTLRSQYEINGLPVHVFIDRGGVVRKIVVGELSPAAMRENVERIVR